MRVRLLPDAESDLYAIRTYVQADYTRAGATWFAGLQQELASLGELPYRGEIVHARKGLRRVLYGQHHNVYLIFYRVDASRDEVVIVQLLHGMRRKSLR